MSAIRFARNINLSIPGRFMCTRCIEKDYGELEKNHKALQAKYHTLVNHCEKTNKEFVTSTRKYDYKLSNANYKSKNERFFREEPFDHHKELQTQYNNLKHQCDWSNVLFLDIQKRLATK